MTIITELLLASITLIIALFDLLDIYFYKAGWLIIAATSLIILIHTAIILIELKSSIIMLLLSQNEKSKYAHRNAISEEI